MESNLFTNYFVQLVNQQLYYLHTIYFVIVCICMESNHSSWCEGKSPTLPLLFVRIGGKYHLIQNKTIQHILHGNVISFKCCFDAILELLYQYKVFRHVETSFVQGRNLYLAGLLLVIQGLFTFRKPIPGLLGTRFLPWTNEVCTCRKAL